MNNVIEGMAIVKWKSREADVSMKDYRLFNHEFVEGEHRSGAAISQLKK
jgi:hypothetical protein